MSKPSERAKQLAESAVDGEGLGPDVLDRIARGMDKALAAVRLGTAEPAAWRWRYRWTGDPEWSAWNYGTVKPVLELRGRAELQLEALYPDERPAAMDQSIAELEAVASGWQTRAESLEALAKHLMVALAACDPDPDAVRENLDIKRLLEWTSDVEQTCDLGESVYAYAVRVLDSPRPEFTQDRGRITALETLGWLMPSGTVIGYAPKDWYLTPLCSLPAAQALLLEQAERIAELEAKLAALERIHKVAAELVTDPSWPEREQDALKWIYQTVEAGWGKDALAPIAEAILVMLGEHTNAECRAATAAHDAEAKLARWQPIARAAARFTYEWTIAARHAMEDSLNALPEQERAELLEEEEGRG